jgi:hypothetical protein
MHKTNICRTILLYSPDADLCNSLKLLLQEQYNVLMSSDLSRLNDLVDAHQPDLMLASVLPIPKLIKQLYVIRNEYPQVKMMIMFAGQFSNGCVQQEILKSINEIFRHPTDLAEAALRICKLVKWN